MFFTDEACALAAGHRPCFSCRREDGKRFVAGRPLAEVDAAIRRERQGRPAVDVASLPDGAMVERDGDAWLVWGGRLHRWAGEGYDGAVPVLGARTARRAARSRTQNGGAALLLTPPTTVELLRAGYVPQVRL